jgi:hypothetical protein
MTLAQSHHPDPDDIPAQAGDADADDALLRYVTRRGAARAGHQALHFHLSRITRSFRTRKHLRVAAGMLKELMAPLPRPPFILKNGDIVLIGKTIDQSRIAEATEMLGYILAGEPLTRGPAEDSALFTLYDLETHYRILLGNVRHIADTEARADAARRPAKSDFQPARIGALIERLGQLELANMVRQQTVWTVPPSGETQPKPLFDELYISVDGLRAAIGFEGDIASDPQFFQLVTRAFDKYMLATLLQDRSAEKRPISINVDLQTLLSPEFQKFEHLRPSGWHGQIILEVQFANVWSDLAAFLAVARAVKENGFSCCIDGVSHHALPLVNFHRLEADYIKVVWDDALLALDEASLRDVCRAFRDCGSDRAILTRCGRQEALQFGLAANLRMFQGWYVDGLGRTPHISRKATPRAS